MSVNKVVASEDVIQPCYKDLVSFTLDHSNYDENKRILIDADDPRRSLSLADARTWVSMTMAAMADQGVKEGDTVCIVTFNDVMFPLMFLSILGLGGRVTATNPVHTIRELSHHFIASKTSFIITTDEIHEKAWLAANAVAEITDAMPPRVLGFRDIAYDEHIPLRWNKFDDRSMATNTVALLASTSGTTGMPKMAVRSHLSLVMENLAIEDEVDKPYEVRRLLCTPFFHGFTMPLAVVSALRLGLPTYVMRRFNKPKFLEYVQKYAITETAMPPPMLVPFLADREDDRVALKNLRLVWSGGAVMSASTQNRACEMLAHEARICQVWGMTEGGWMTTLHYPERDDTGSAGRLIGTYEAKVREPAADNEGPDLPAGQTGEIWVRGPINMLGYFEDEEGTQQTLVHDGWLKTGDLGYVKDGLWFIRDRIKDIIKIRGWHVSPAEIESRLLEHPDVIDAGVVGTRTQEEDGGEIPFAFIVLRHPFMLTDDAIKEFLLGGLARYKVSETEIRFKDSLPKSPAGKTLKTALRIWADMDIAAGLF